MPAWQMYIFLSVFSVYHDTGDDKRPEKHLHSIHLSSARASAACGFPIFFESRHTHRLSSGSGGCLRLSLLFQLYTCCRPFSAADDPRSESASPYQDLLPSDRRILKSEAPYETEYKRLRSICSSSYRHGQISGTFPSPSLKLLPFSPGHRSAPTPSENRKDSAGSLHRLPPSETPVSGLPGWCESSCSFFRNPAARSETASRQSA